MKYILAFGDSNTYGIIPGSAILEQFPRDVRWTGILEKEIAGLKIIDDGLCGRTFAFEDATRPGRKGLDTLPQVLEELGGGLKDEMRDQQLAGIIIMLGTNDCKSAYRATEQEIGEALEKMVGIVERYQSLDKLLIISPLHLGENVWLPEKDPEFDAESVELSRKLKAVYEAIAEKHGAGFLAASDYAAANETDDEHLDEEGHAKLAQAIKSKLIEMGIV